MGINIALETEDGVSIWEILDPNNLLHKILPSYDDLSFVCLRFVDWYGDTTFNRIQMDSVLSELQRLYDVTEAVEERNLLRQISNLAHRCKDEPHLYLKFYGD